MIEKLEAFKVYNDHYPDNVIVYRDGVGDSQIATFVRREVNKYRKAFEKLRINPKLGE
jgi:hypothetical protein